MVQSKKVITLIVLSLCTGRLRGETRWSAVQGEGFEIMTDSQPTAAVRVAQRLDRMRQIFGARNGVLPLRVALLGSESLFASLRPSVTVGGFFQTSADQDWIVVRWGQADSERAATHEMVHAFLEHSGPRRPLWLEEGLAEFYSTMSIDGQIATIGAPVEAHVRSLNRNAWLGEREFFEAQPDSAMREEGSRVGRFYSQSWALVHYLLTTPGVREKAPELMEALARGETFSKACVRILGQRQGLLLESARRAVERRQFRTARIAAGGHTGTYAARPLAAEEAEERLAELAVDAGRPQAAERIARTATQRGLLALARGDKTAAERLFEEAVATNSPAPAAYFELAMLLRESNRMPDRTRALLRQTIERNPNHAEAHFLLGLRAAASGDEEGAIDYYQTAARLLPRQATFWHALALALERSGRRAEAAHAALRCRMAARNPTEREMAAGLARLVQLTPDETPTPAQRQTVVVPEGWNGLRGDAEAKGTLVEFDCVAQPPVAHVETAAGRLALRVARPREIRITGTGSAQHTFGCGAQEAKVNVQYLRATGELTAIDFQ